MNYVLRNMSNKMFYFSKLPSLLVRKYLKSIVSLYLLTMKVEYNTHDDDG